ncbi:MAG: hypothetical protein HZA24_02705 [Nitrospirae bacterium]|nr:hypothetical protein [Nitrospirota bacterium]
MATLHILRNFDRKLMDDTIDTGAGDQILLVQDAVLHPGPFPCTVSVSQDDMLARNVQPPYEALSYAGIRDLMIAHARVVLW